MRALQPHNNIPSSSLLYEFSEVIDGFDITFWAVPSFVNDFGDMEPADEARIIQDIEEGKLVDFVAEVICSQLGQPLSRDMLGSCVYRSCEEFHTTCRDDYYTDMVKYCIAEAKERIQSLEGLPP